MWQDDREDFCRKKWLKRVPEVINNDDYDDDDDDDDDSNSNSNNK